MVDKSVLLEQAQATSEVMDHTKTSEGGPRLPVEGKSLARLVGVIELGTQPQEYQGEPTPPCREVQLVFEVGGKKNIDEFEVDGKKIKRGRILRPYTMTMKTSPRATFKKIFDQLDYGRGYKTIFQFLDDVYYLQISHAKTGAGKEYAKIDSIMSPLVDEVDEDGEVVGQISRADSMPPSSYGLQMFSVDSPSLDQWNSIKIDGTYTRKTKDEDGKEVEEEVSKNFYQDAIMNSLDWEGSAMQALLLDLEEDDEEEEVEEKPKPKKKAAPKKKASKKVEPEEDDEDDDSTEADLAELGLDG